MNKTFTITCRRTLFWPEHWKPTALDSLCRHKINVKLVHALQKAEITLGRRFDTSIGLVHFTRRKS